MEMDPAAGSPALWVGSLPHRLDRVRGSHWSEHFGRSALGPNVFTSRLDWLPDLFGQLAYPGLQYVSPAGPWHAAVAFADGGWLSRRRNGFAPGSLHGDWVVGFGALRHLCALLRLEPPRLLKEERTLPHPVLLAGEVARQMRDEREALSERARLLLTIDTALAHVPDVVFRMLGAPERPRTGLDEAGTAAVLHATAAAFAERVAMPHRTGPVWSPTAITGYRLWGLGIKPEPDAGPRLFGAYGREWATGHLEASCDEDPLRPVSPAGRAGRRLHLLGPEGPEPPHLRHRCGIYAYKDLSPLLRFRVPLSSWTVLGRVEMWGKVIEHEHGYRAQHCRIVKAVVLAPRTRLLQAQWPELVRRFGDISRLPGVNHHTITHSWCGNCSDKIDLERNPQLKTEIRRALTP